MAGRALTHRAAVGVLVVVGLLPGLAAFGAPSGEPTSVVVASTATTPSTPAAARGRVTRAGTPASRVEPFVPTLLRLAAGAEAAIRPAGVDSAGTLVVPDDPRSVGWWTGGARVGDPFGSVVVAGHLDSRLGGIGVLAELLDARPGDFVTVEGAGLAAEYRVTEVFDVPKAELTPSTGVFRQDTDHALVLVTCTGEFDDRTRSYADNLVVVATPVR